MDFNKLNKANKIYLSITELDKEIIEIEKFALMAADGVIKSSLELKVEYQNKKEDEPDKVKFDEDGSLMTNKTPKTIFDQYMVGSWLYASRGSEEPKNDNLHTYKTEIHENTILGILGILLREKQYKREIFLKKLEKLGIKIN